jgi:uncharacterized RDD family membrane protein YckC
MNPVPAHVVKRSFAGLVDAAILVFISLSIYAFISIPIVNQFANGNVLAEALAQRQVASYLFVEDSNLYIQPVSEGQYPEAIYRYYVESDVTHDPMSTSAYYLRILKQGDATTLFDFSQPMDALTPWLITPLTNQSDQVTAFYRTTYLSAVEGFENTPAMLAISQPLNQRLILSLVITFAVTGLGVYVLVPLSLVQGATLGQRLWRLFLVHSHDGVPLRRSQIIIKGIATIIFLVFGVFFLLPFISYIVMLSNKKRQAITDYFAVTMVVEKHPNYR